MFNVMSIMTAMVFVVSLKRADNKFEKLYRIASEEGSDFKKELREDGVTIEEENRMYNKYKLYIYLISIVLHMGLFFTTYYLIDLIFN